MNIEERLAQLATLMEERLGIGGAGFETKLARAGRKLPRRLKREGLALIQARDRARHPKLGRQIDQRRIEQAARAFERHLIGLDYAEQRMTFWIYWLAGNALNILIVMALAVAFVVWRGLV